MSDISAFQFPSSVALAFSAPALILDLATPTRFNSFVCTNAAISVRHAYISGFHRAQDAEQRSRAGGSVAALRVGSLRSRVFASVHL